MKNLIPGDFEYQLSHCLLAQTCEPWSMPSKSSSYLSTHSCLETCFVLVKKTYRKRRGGTFSEVLCMAWLIYTLITLVTVNNRHQSQQYSCGLWGKCWGWCDHQKCRDLRPRGCGHSASGEMDEGCAPWQCDMEEPWELVPIPPEPGIGCVLFWNCGMIVLPSTLLFQFYQHSY